MKTCPSYRLSSLFGTFLNTIFYHVSDRITIQYNAPDHIAEGIEAHLDYLKEELLADNITRTDNLDDLKPSKVSGEKVQIQVTKA